MKIKRVILSLLMLLSYLSSVGMSAYALLSCHCAERMGETAHVCCSECQDQHNCDAHKTMFSSNCCGAHNNTKADLYTIHTSSSNNERHTKYIMVVVLPDALAPKGYDYSIFDSAYTYLTQQPAPLIAESTTPQTGLRAPPAIA